MVSQSLIVFCCICGAGVLVFIGWAVSHRFVPPAEAKEPAAGDFNQAQYMREVRLRHQDQLAAVMGGASALVGERETRCRVLEFFVIVAKWRRSATGLAFCALEM
ncbi:hypothetical protein D0862_02564 [Hortaea werneckii]|uniref:Uncharacterized protein n=1 Tax=Hortaea werneckii TaxID=91943 RepID=A0A3M7HGW7_HORWE|nr:hypothetical protein D0862_02564 [Hortaea werneckii]